MMSLLMLYSMLHTYRIKECMQQPVDKISQGQIIAMMYLNMGSTLLIQSSKMVKNNF